MRSKSFSTPMICVTNTTVSTGASSGTVTRRKIWNSEPPSVRAASSTSRGIAARPARDDHHREAGGRPDVGEHDRRRDQLLAEPVDALKGSAKVSGVDLDPVLAGPTRRPRRRKVPSASVVVVATVSPPESRAADGHAREGPTRPPRPRPRVPPPGLKSRQTTPAIPPSTRLRLRRVRRILGHLVGEARP